MSRKDENMRMLATFATLLVGLAIVFWAPTAKAHCPHGNSTTHEHCIVPPPPPGATLGDLSCTTDQIAKFDGAQWVCDGGGAKVIFASSDDTFTGNLGGVAGADATCNTLAANAGLSGNFKAWLGTWAPLGSNPLRVIGSPGLCQLTTARRASSCESLSESGCDTLSLPA